MKHLLLASLALLAACQAPTSPGFVPVSLTGCYTYKATRQDAPGLVIEGRLRIEDQSGAILRGSIDALVSLPDGRVTQVSGLIGGELLDSATLEFTWSFPTGESRRHLGTLSASGSQGQWLSLNPQLTGTYTFTPGCP